MNGASGTRVLWCGVFGNVGRRGPWWAGYLAGGGWIDLHAEAGEFALLQVVVDEEADADGEGDEARGCDGVDFADLDDPGEDAAEEDEAEAYGAEDDAGAAGVGETAERVPGEWCGVLLPGADEAFDVVEAHAAG